MWAANMDAHALTSSPRQAEQECKSAPIACKSALCLYTNLSEHSCGEQARHIARQIQDASERGQLSAVAPSGIQHDLRQPPSKRNDCNG